MNLNFKNLYLFAEYLKGNESQEIKQKFEGLTGDELEKSLKIILNNPKIPESIKKNFPKTSWRINYRRRPPTMEEFLTDKWIGPTGLTIYDHVKKALIEFWGQSYYTPGITDISGATKKYRHLILASSIGWGKSLASAISALYIIVCLSLMRNPKNYFGLSQATTIVIALISFSLKKAEQILLQPFFQILTTSPRFKRVMREEKLEERQKEFPDKIIWTSAGRVGSIQFVNDLHILIASEPAHLLGLTLMCAVFSEISFFIERGISPETIWRIYNDAKGRVYSRFGTEYFASTILDSSPNDMELSPIDKYIFGGAAYKDQTNYIVTSTHWDVFPEKYPEWQKTKKTFTVYRGSATKPPRLIDNEDELKNYNSAEIYKVPIDIHQHFIDNLKKSIKDYCGYPGGSTAKLFESFDVIENMFTVQLKNIYTSIYAPADKAPEYLIWNQIKNDFFIEIEKGHFVFYRNPNENRYIHCDLSESHDVAGIGCVHPELNKNGNMIVIVDFSIAIVPRNSKINLDAIACFIIDLIQLGNMRIAKISSDRFQSSPLIQRLQRLDYNIDKFSVDRTKEPYYVLASWIKNGRIKSGRNIFLKNNLKSLQEVVSAKGHSKIDHVIVSSPVYDDGANWETSLMGLGQKDVSDGVCGAVNHCISDFKGVPKYQWYDDEKNMKLTNKKIKTAILENLHNDFSFQLDKS